MRDFYLERTEVTVRDYRACVAARACSRDIFRLEYPGCAQKAGGCTSRDLRHLCNYHDPSKGTHPMNCVTLQQSMDFCEWVGGRLPTSVEWVWAARGRDEARRHPWGEAPPTCDLVSKYGCSDEQTLPVGSAPKGASRDGILDLVGNVSELLRDADGHAFDAGGGAGDAHERHFTISTAISAVAPQRHGNPDVGFRCVHETISM
ncbi:formylglycine-generating enzyme family protein [Nannocystaceae bacterium ST9]